MKRKLNKINKNYDQNLKKLNRKQKATHQKMNGSFGPP